jgi:hypothetical protein
MTSHWPHINTVNLTLVLTAYQANCGIKKTTQSMLKNVKPPGPNFALCGKDPGQCISKGYFCDKRFNCALDGVPKPQDEANCQVEPVSGDAEKPPNDQDKDGQQEGGGLEPGSLNLISWALIIICSVLALILGLILSIGCTRNSFCRRDGSSALECPPGTMTATLDELSAQRPQTVQNVYLPLDTFRDGARPPAGVGIPEEPPPAYNELFPNDYRHQEETSLATSS